MKYVIKFNNPSILGETYPYVDAYVSGLTVAKFKDRRKTPGVNWTPFLSKAIIYDSWDAASCIVSMVSKRYSSARIYGIHEKELFKARLQICPST